MTIQTDRELFDLLASAFGLGVEQGQYQQAVEQVRSLRLAHDVSIVEVARAVAYCQQFHHPIREIAQVFAYIPKAKQWWVEDEKQKKNQQLNTLIRGAALVEMQAGNSVWMNQLLRAYDREKVYADWARTRSHLYTHAA